MTKTDNNKTLHIKLQSSLLKRLFIVVPHLIVILIIFACLFWTDTKSIYLFVSVILITFSFIYFFKLHIKKDLKNSVLCISKNTNDDWYLDSKEIKNQKVFISGSSFASELLIILNLVDQTNKQFSAIVTRDSIEIAQFRKLKVYIKTHKLIN